MDNATLYALYMDLYSNMTHSSGCPSCQNPSRYMYVPKLDRPGIVRGYALGVAGHTSDCPTLALAKHLDNAGYRISHKPPSDWRNNPRWNPATGYMDR